MSKVLPKVEMMRVEDMDPAEVRVLVAQDVLDLLEAQAIRAFRGRYIDMDLRSSWEKSKQLQEFVDTWLQEETRACEVCALGAMMLATVRRFDALTVGECIDLDTDRGAAFNVLRRSRNLPTSYLGRFFSKEQLDLIEIVFEDSLDIRGLPQSVRDKFGGNMEQIHNFRGRVLAGRRDVNQYNDYKASRDVDRIVLKAVLENIVRNKGTFILDEDLPAQTATPAE